MISLLKELGVFKVNSTNVYVVSQYGCIKSLLSSFSIFTLCLKSLIYVLMFVSIVLVVTRNKKMEPCISPYPDVNSPDDPDFNSPNEVSGGELTPFPERLYAVPPRIASGSIPGVSVETYLEDNRLWKKHVNAYKKINKIIDSGRYRNIMDMNAGLGGFAAALESPKLWVMNVVPTIAEKNTLGAVYERGLIGIYHDW